jgi:hypothetical protein
VVKQKSMNDTFIMLKITATADVFEKEALRTGIRLPLKKDLRKTPKGRIGSFMSTFERSKPVELCYDKFDDLLKDSFDGEKRMNVLAQQRQKRLLI